MIDDSIKNCMAINDTKTQVLLFNSKANYNVNTDFKRVYNFREIYECILEKSNVKK